MPGRLFLVWTLLLLLSPLTGRAADPEDPALQAPSATSVRTEPAAEATTTTRTTSSSTSTTTTTTTTTTPPPPTTTPPTAAAAAAVANTSTTTTVTYVKRLAISISPTVIQLPTPSSEITAIVVPAPAEGERYNYKWTVVRYPEGPQGSVENSDEKVVRLSNLQPGNYTVRVTVGSASANAFGEVYANFTVLPPKRVNEPPVAVIRPSSQTIRLPNDVALLDGSSSSDDTGLASYNWQLESGPLSYQLQPVDSQTLQLKGLVEGNYTFKLTVVDVDGSSDAANGTVQVVKETDYPPEANAGAPVVVNLPQDSLTLNGNQSKDDHGIVSWQWTRLLTDDEAQAKPPPVDMQDSLTPYLRLSKLAEGLYRFQLQVTDAAGQSSSTQVDVLVRHPVAAEPRADAGADATLALPLNWAALNGTSTGVDVADIVQWQWKQLQGPNAAVLDGADRPMANATGLTKGVYVFQLSVWNAAGASSSDNVTVTVQQDENRRPKANAGGDRSVSLPLRWVSLDGSNSSDDLAVRSWLWTRESDSLAAGSIVADTDRTSTLMLTNLVPGRYVFRLTVTDDQGLSDYDVATLLVRADPRRLDAVTLTLASDAAAFTEGELTTLRDQIRLLLHQPGSVDVSVHMDDVVVDPRSGHPVLQFYTSVKAADGAWRHLPAPQVAELLRRKVRADAGLLVAPVVDVDTAVCQNNCSGHGVCDRSSRRCVCHTFWMQNGLAVLTGAQPNCDWSLLYVVIVASVLAAGLVAVLWSLVRLCRRGSLPCRAKRRQRPQHRYAPLQDPNAIRMSAQGALGGHQLLPSDPDESQETEEESEEVVFDKNKTGLNGHAFSDEA